MANWKDSVGRAASLLRTWCSAAWGGLRRGGLALGRGGLAVVRSGAWKRCLRLLRSSLRVGVVAVVLGFTAFGVLTLGVHRVPPGTWGVRQARLGSGLQQQDFGTGLYLAPGDSWHHLSASVHEVRFAWDSEGGTQEILPLVTRDGEELQVAAGVLYRIRQGAAWELVRAGLAKDYPVRAAAIARRVLMEEFQLLVAEDWFVPESRQAAVAAVEARLQSELAEVFLEPEEVFLSGVYFASTFEKKRLQRQLDAQGKLTSLALQRRRAADMELEEAKAERAAAERERQQVWTARLEAIRLEGEAQVAQIQREAQLEAAAVAAAAEDEYQRAFFEGKQALAQAEDLEQKLRAQTLAGPGGAEFLALQAAEKLSFGTVKLDSSQPGAPNPLDLEGMVGRLLGR